MTAPTILGVDPGTHESAYVVLSPTGRVLDHAKLENWELLRLLRARLLHFDTLAVEMVASYGMPVGAEVFETCLWIGRFLEASASVYRLVYRKDVKMFLCGRTAGVNDAVIRTRLVDLFGPGKLAAVGTVKAPGPLHGLKGDEWAALGVALYARHAEETEAKAAASA